MKKLIFLVCLLIGVGMSANLYAADTGYTPSIGSKHTYAVTSVGGATYAWTVTTTADGSGTNYLDGTVVSGTSVTNSIELTWLTPTVGTSYYVHVVATNANCTNHKAITVVPANAFELDIASMTSAYVVNALNTAANYCAADVTVALPPTPADNNVTSEANAQNFDYNYNSTYLYYRIEAKGIDYANVGWKPKVTLTNTNVAGSTVTASWGTTLPNAAPMGGYTTFASEATLNVGVGNQYIYIQVEVNNKKSKDDPAGNEGIALQSVEIGLDGSTDATSNAVTAINGAGDDNAINNITARPNIGVIDTD